jgi:hypothetical protein
MAKTAKKAIRKAARGPKKIARRKAARPARRATKRQAKRPKPAATARTSGAKAKKRPQKAPSASRRKSPAPARPIAAKVSRLDRARRILSEDETVLATPPSSLDMVRRGSAARTGRAELEDNRREHHGMSPAITGGDVDVDLETAYFSGDEAPGGDNPTPDQDIVDDIGRALGVEYQDNEELKSGDKVIERDKHRWELDPASSEDYKDRK